MKLTPNQYLQLLWIHYHEPAHDIGLSPGEVVSLELDIVSMYDSLDGPYFDKLVPKNRDELLDFFLSGSASPFNEAK